MKKSGAPNQKSSTMPSTSNMGGPSTEEMNHIVALFNQGDLNALESASRKITEAWPQHGFGWKALGVSLKMLNKDAEAIPVMRKAVELLPDDFDVFNNLASAVREQGQLDEAIAYYRRALEIRPEYPEALNGLGMTLRAKGESTQALECYETAIKLYPGYPEAYNNYGNALRELGKSREALVQYTKALDLRKDYVDALNGMGNALMGLNNPIAAIQHYQRAVDIRPDFPEALNGLGNAYKANGMIDEAIAHYRKSIAARPNYADPYHNLANVCRDQEDIDGAIDYYRQALAVKPDYHSAAAGVGMALLTKGDMAKGWEYYELRWQGFQQAMEGALKPPETNLPQWKGETPKPGEAILLFCEQGLGDSLQFIRYVPLVAAHFEQVTVICPSALVNIFRGSFQSSKIEITDRQPKIQTRWQWHCSMLSLPLALGSTLDNLPATVPYLKAPENRISYWQQRLAQETDARKPRIGLVWAGGNLLKDDSKRSIPPHLLKPLLQNQNFSWISLQKSDKSSKKVQGELASLLIDWMDEIKDFADTAALIENLDIVISVDTSVAHLAGGLGKPVWMLNRLAGDWRWMVKRADSPWYPSMRLFRQTQAGDWLDVIDRVIRELKAWQGLEIIHPEKEQRVHLSPDIATIQHLLNLFSNGANEEHRNQSLLLREQYPDPEKGFVSSYSNILNGFADSLMKGGNIAEAVRYFEESLMINLDQIEVTYTLGCLYIKIRNLEIAIQKLRQVLAQEPEHYRAHLSLAIALLSNGEWQEGWKEYEYRYLGSNYVVAGKITKPEINLPEWTGQTVDPNDKLIVICEQGFGDCIQFIRYLTLMTSRFAHVTVICPKSLLAIFQHSFQHLKNLELIAGIPLKKINPDLYQWHGLLLSMPYAFRTDLNDLPSSVPYLRTPPVVLEKWTGRVDLLAEEKYRVGLVWTSNPMNTDLKNRSIDAAHLAPLFDIPGIIWINLQKEKIDGLPDDLPLINWMDEITDFSQTAAIIEQLDLVISVDTSVAHLAGALGKPVWLLNRYESDWRWMLNREDSPWYPSMRIFNQPQQNDWTAVIKQVSTALKDHAKHDFNAPVSSEDSEDIQKDLQKLLDAFNSQSIERYQSLLQSIEADYQKQAKSIRSHYTQLLNRFGYQFYKAGNHNEASKCLLEATRLDAANFYAHHHLGVIFNEMRRPEEAAHHLRLAIKLEPELHFSKYTLSSSLLSMGLFEEGWKYYEYRWHGSDQAMEGKKKKPKIPLPEWQAQTNTNNDHLLVYFEQGFGDQIQFIRLIPQVAELFKHVTLVTSAPTFSLFAHSLSDYKNVSGTRAMPASFDAYNWQSALISLPMHLNIDAHNIPAKTYLSAPADRLQKWQVRFASQSNQKPRIGIVFSGSAGLTDDKKRSIDPALLLPLLSKQQYFWLSLQKNAPDIKTVPDTVKAHLHDWMTEVEDFADTAAIISQLDLVISVDTAVAHLAGAMGKPVWLLNRFDSDWRWLVNQEQSAWYPSMRIFNQQKMGDWPKVISDIAQALEQWHPTPRSIQDQLELAQTKTNAPFFSVDPISAGQQHQAIQHEDPANQAIQDILDLLDAASLEEAVKAGQKKQTKNTLIAQHFTEIARQLLLQSSTTTPRSLTVEELQKSIFKDSLSLYAEALKNFQSIPQTTKNRPQCLHKFASCLLANGRVDAAIAYYQLILQLKPDFVESITNLATAYLKKSDLQQATALYRKALEIKPDFTIALNGLGVACKMLGNFTEALQHLQKAVDIEPNNAELLNNLGATYLDMHQLDKAIPLFRKSIQANADYHVAHMGLALALLMNGEWEEGWQYYEYRWQGSHSALQGIVEKPQTPSPQWQGEDVQEDSGLLIFCEQGIGDNFQFARYIRLAAQRFSRVAVLCPTPLINILRGSMAGLSNVSVVNQIVDEGKSWQYHIHMMSLPLAFKTTQKNVPNHVPYLLAPQNRVSFWEARLAPIAANKPRVGIVWAGGDKLRDDKERSIALSALLPLLQVDSVCWVSLQKSSAITTETAEIRDHYLTDWMQEIQDFADTSALIQTLDLVISVDTSVAHLAGAMGKPVWLFNRYSGDWRWMLNREDSPWYPSMRIFNQPSKGDWVSVINNMQQALVDWIKNHQPSASIQPSQTEVQTVLDLFNQQLWVELETATRKMVADYPSLGFGYKSLAIALLMQKRNQEALPVFAKAAELLPTDADVHNNLGNLLAQSGNINAAKSHYEKAIHFNHNLEQAYSNLAVLHYEKNEIEAAIPYFRKSLDLKPDNPTTWFNLGVGLKEIKHNDEAIDCYNKALALDPNYMDAMFNRGLSRLTLGQYETGWQDYEARFLRPHKKPLPATNYPVLSADVDIKGKRILIQSEQGFGDCIQMSRYVNLLQARGAECWLQVSHSLLGLMTRSFAKTHVIDAKICPQDLDYRVPLMSLPLIMQTFSEAAIPAAKSYLVADKKKIEDWASKLPTGKPRIGLAWRGSPSNVNDHNRSATLQEVMQIIEENPDKAFVTLQKNLEPDDRNILENLANVTILDHELSSFDETAAVICNLDLVVSIDTSVAHVSAGLGKPTWLMLAFRPCWRWLMERSDSPWYPTARLFRQKNRKEWTSLVAEVSLAIKKFKK